MLHIDAPSRRRGVVAAALLLCCLALVACGNGGAEQSSAPPPPPDAPASEVTIRLIAYRPDVVRVPAGTRVTWTQEDPGAHTVTSGVVEQQPGGVMARPDGRFDSGNIAEGQTFSIALDSPGTYPYFCAIHPSTMRGTVEIS